MNRNTRRASMLGTVAGVAALSVATAGQALAAWNSTGTGKVAAAAGSLSVPAGGGAAPASSTSMTITWTVPSAGTVQAASTYFVTGGGTCNALATAGTCTVTGLTANTPYNFQLTAKRANNWTSSASSTFSGTTSAGFSVSSVSPSARGQNSTAAVINVNGTGFVNGAQVALSGSATGVNVTNVTYVSPTLITFQLALTANAAVGQRNVVVTNPSSVTATCTNCFTVNPAPTITSGAQTLPHGGVQTSMTITGTGFVAGFVPTVTGSSNYTIVSSSYTSSTQVSVTVQNNNTGNGSDKASLVITNPDGGSVSKQVIQN